ncbi:MAG: hypothetical protein JWM90_67 [Thermoleophilia bacterium]|nr:hypothetical protein [Thermoleophilia bacterium]
MSNFDLATGRHPYGRFSSSSHYPVAKLVLERQIDPPLLAYGAAGNAKGYASVASATKALAALSEGEAPAIGILHDKGRFYGFGLYEGPDWLMEGGLDPLKRETYVPFELADDTKLKFKTDALIAVVDGSRLLRRG